MIEVATKDIFQLKTIDQILFDLEKYCQLNDYSFAAWRMPHSQGIQLVINFSEGEVVSSENQLEDFETGFVCAPFDKSQSAHFIKADVRIDFHKKTILVTPAHTLNFEKVVEFIRQNDTPATKEFKSKQTNSSTSEQAESTRFKDLVSNAISQIRDGIFQKVVTSRIKKIELNKHFRSSTNFLRLCDAYENAFVSLIYSPKVGLWLGATPEILIKTNKSNHQFTTVALAGTQRFDSDQSLAEVAWTQKEIEEQALVSRYIINCFKKIRLREFDEIGPKTVKAGNLIHLKTTFLVDMKDTNFPLLGSVMLKLLHPTSAVCGMPLEASLNFLKQQEQLDRKLFSGYIGPVDNQNETALFVNLRCMRILDSVAYLYAGAGITEDSNPEKEWIETEMKMKTLLNIIQ